MKKSSLFLFDLIKSMSAYEKSQFINTFSDREMLYVQLFKKISSNLSFNEAELIEYYEECGGKRETYPRMKSYLYDQLLQFLIQLNEVPAIEQELNQAIESIHFLVSRTLIDQAESLIKRSKKKALKHNLFMQVTELLMLEYIIIREKFHAKDIIKSVNNLRKELEEMETFYSNYFQTMTLELEVFERIMQIQSSDFRNNQLIPARSINKLERAVENTKVMNSVVSINAAYVRALVEYYNNNLHTAIDILTDALSLFNENATLQQLYTYKYLLVLNNIGDVALLIDRPELTEQVFTHLQALTTKSKFVNSTIEVIYMNLLTRKLTIFPEKNEAYTNEVQQLTNSFLAQKYWTVPRVTIGTTFQLIQLNFEGCKYGKCLVLIQRLRNGFYENLESETLSALIILEIIISIENKDDSLFISKLNSLKNNPYSERPFLLNITQFFSSLSGENYQLSKEKIAETLGHFQQIKGLKSRVIIKQSLILHWLQSKLD